MKTIRFFLAGSIALVVASGARAQEEFVRGHLFVAVFDADACDFGGLEAIVEIDPTTGAWSVFADSSDGICVVNGLRFTPNEERLLALNAGHLLPNDNGWVQAFAPDGSSTVLLDASDGLARPFGANALAFDAAGNLYVVNTLGSTILRFPAGGGPATVFADAGDGIQGRGALDFAPNGDLFYAGDLAGAIIRITPEGEASVFDDPPTPSSLAFDHRGNLFVGGGGATIYRYDHANPNSRRVLASGFMGVSGVPKALTLSPDGRVVYFAEIEGTVYRIDAQDGTTTVLADLSDLPFQVVVPGGITVFPDPLGGVPTASEWGLAAMALVVLTAGTLVLIRRQPGQGLGDSVQRTNRYPLAGTRAFVIHLSSRFNDGESS